MPKKENIDLTIVSPVFNKAPYLKGFLYSLLEQDIWERMELIWVENGSTDGSWNTMNNLYNKLGKKRRENIKLLRLKEANRGHAINEGVKYANGRYWSFLPSDAALFPGAARTWVESLDEFPEYGFLYGGYRFAPPHGGVYTSEQYDEYFIKQYNYIDGSFPLKRELYPYFNKGGHDPDIKSLQDWDFWLAVILGEDKKGGKTKGLYRPEIFFETIPPQPGGMSDDSHRNWVERTKQIKDKWGIKESEICVTAPGAPFHAKNIAKILGAEFRVAPQFKPHNFKLIYLLGFYPQIAQQCVAVFSSPSGAIVPAKKVIHWIGTDIWGLLNTSILNLDKLKEQFDLLNFVHLTEFEQTHAEMKKLGIDTKIVPLPPAKLYDLMPLPKKFTLAVYMPDQNAEFYYKDLMYEVADLLPDVDFLFFGDRFNQSKKKNIQHVGYIEDMEKFIKECSAILRLTVHDGLPLSLIEFITAGRNAIFNIQMPYMVHINANNKELIAQRIRDTQKLSLNENGSKYYRELVDHNKYRKTIYNFLKGSSYNPKKYWESRANGWELQAQHGVYPHLKEVESVLEGINYNNVLDIGCGNGRWFPYFEGKGKEYIGIDISEKLVAIAKQYYPKADFQATTIEKYTTDKKYDLAFVYTCLQHIKPEDLEKTVNNIKKLSKYTLLIESSQGWDGSYGFNHDYSKYFNIVKTTKAEKADDNPNETLTLMLVDNEKGVNN